MIVTTVYAWYYHKPICGDSWSSFSCKSLSTGEGF